jgi:hypothetical protein
MNGFTCGTRVGMVLAAVCALAAGAMQTGAAESAAISRSTSSAVCSVTAENAWGIPTVVQTGFLIGDGRFLVTDLGPIARDFPAQLLLGFQDGSVAVARQFGLADPGLGLVILRVEELKAEGSKTAPEAPKVDRTGLALVTVSPSLEFGPSVVQAGWEWSDRLETAAARLRRGPTTQEVAAPLKIEPPKSPESFLQLDGVHLDAASGSPILDVDGKVVAITLEMSTGALPVILATPAVALREALTTGQPQLKGLAELPKSIWPTQGLRLPGKPGGLDVPKVNQDIAKGMFCLNCGGKGKLEGPPAPAGRTAAVAICPTCHGEKRIISKDLTTIVAGPIEVATRTVWAPVMDDRVRAAMREWGRDTLKTLTSVGPFFEQAYAEATTADLASPSLEFPRGIVLQCTVQSHVEGPDGMYLLLAPWKGNVTAAVRLDDMLTLGARTPMSARKDPADGTWIGLVGSVLSAFDTGKVQGAFVLPLEWMVVENPATAKTVATPATTAAPATQPARTNSTPGFVPGRRGGWGRRGF